MREKSCPELGLVPIDRPSGETGADTGGQFRLQEIEPGTYLLRIVWDDGGAKAVGRLVISPDLATTIVSLDLSSIEVACDGDED